MIGLEGKDNSFFIVEPDWVAGASLRAGFPESLKRALSDKVKSIEIKEEIGKLIHGSIEFHDDDMHNISYLLRLGKQLRIGWGYKAWDTAVSGVTGSGDMITAGMPSRVFAAYVAQPAGSGSATGEISYSCEFFQSFSYGPGNKAQLRRWYYPMQKGVIVRQLMTELGIAPDKQFVQFNMMNDYVDWYGGLCQDNEPAFKFLNRVALEWRCFFRIAYTPNTMEPVGIFISPGTPTPWAAAVTGGIGLYNEFRYKTSQYPNVKSYSWNYSCGQNGSGDNVQVMTVNGQTQFWRSQATTEKVIFYKLNTEKMQQEMGQADLKQKTDLIKSWLGEDSFDELIRKQYYVPVESTTAPQGIGLTINLECLGNPLMTSPNSAVFRGAFPDYFLDSDKRGIFFFIKSVTHKIDRSGYNMSVEVVDAFTLTGGSLVG